MCSLGVLLNALDRLQDILVRYITRILRQGQIPKKVKPDHDFVSSGKKWRMEWTENIHATMILKNNNG